MSGKYSDQHILLKEEGFGVRAAGTAPTKNTKNGNLSTKKMQETGGVKRRDGLEW